MKFYGQLEKAAQEVLASDPAQGVTGRFWFNSTSGTHKSDDGTLIRSMLRNDGKLVIGNNGTANTNIRLNRAGTSVLQFVKGGDATAEGSLSTSLAQLSFQFETYTDAGKPAAGQAGRLAWISDLTILKIDNGATWSKLLMGTISLTTEVSGTLPIANGGTNITTYTTGDILYASATNVLSKLPLGANGQFLGITAGVPTWATSVATAPTIQKFLSGSGTYTTPVSPAPLYIRVRMVGGGAGGSGGGGNTSTNGLAGGNTTFGTALLVANGAPTVAWGASFGEGGTASLGAAVGINLQGGSGGGFFNGASGGGPTPVSAPGGMGGVSAFGGSGGNSPSNVSGNDGKANTGSGGSGGGINSGSTSFDSGTGGGAGGYIDALIYTPSATYSYAVGAGGSGGSASGAGGNAGGSGGSGLIEVTEHYQ